MNIKDDYENAEIRERERTHALVKKYGRELIKYFNLPSAVVPGKISVKGIVLRGDPREELIRKANEVKASVLIIGSRGLGSFKRTFLGSVSNSLVNHADIPVIVVKKECK
jgi:nucleotide-binding universal stress UspA family protein